MNPYEKKMYRLAILGIVLTVVGIGITVFVSIVR